MYYYKLKINEESSSYGRPRIYSSIFQFMPGTKVRVNHSIISPKFGYVTDKVVTQDEVEAYITVHGKSSIKPIEGATEKLYLFFDDESDHFGKVICMNDYWKMAAITFEEIFGRKPMIILNSDAWSTWVEANYESGDNAEKTILPDSFLDGILEKRRKEYNEKRHKSQNTEDDNNENEKG